VTDVTRERGCAAACEYDRDIVSVYIPLREYDCSELCRERVECTFEEQSLSLTVHLPRSNRAVLAVRKLARPIVPEQCKVRVDVAAKRVILKLKKKDNSKDVARWGGLADGYHAMPNKNPLRVRRARHTRWPFLPTTQNAAVSLSSSLR
jgi:hypothetical protein